MQHGRFLTWCVWFIWCVTGGASSLIAADSLSQKVDRRLREKANARCEFSIQVCDPETGAVLFSHNAEKPLVPASNMKLVTTAAALELLGPEFAYETTISRWNENLLVMAAGDPLTGDPKVAAGKNQTIFYLFDQLCEALKAEGIDVISGELLIDDTIFEDVRFHPSWSEKQANNWYMAQVSGLNFNDNCVDIVFSPAGRPGELVNYSLMPNTTYISVENTCKTSNMKNAVGALRQIGTNKIRLIGQCKTETLVNVTVDRPSAFFGYVMAEYLLRNGIRIEGKLSLLRDSLNHELPGEADNLVTYRTPLAEVLRACNQRSLNMASECLLKTLGAYFGKDAEDGVIDERWQPGRKPQVQGSWASGCKVIEAFLSKTGARQGEYALDDGCGLSYENKLSAAALCRVLSFMYKSGHYETYRESLSTPEEGTLAKRPRQQRLKDVDDIWAKTGFVNVSNALSGYCECKSGRIVVFSILSNRPPAPTSTLDGIVNDIYEAF